MEFGVVGRSFADRPWREFVQALVQLGVDALELDTRPNAHCSTWSPDLDPSTIVQDLKDKGLRVGAVLVNADLVQPDPASLAQEVEVVIDAVDLSFRYRSEIVRLSPQRAKPGMSREAAFDSVRQACLGLLGHAEENAILVCLQPDGEVLADVETIRRLLEACESYNLKVSLDPLALLRALKDPEAVRAVIGALLADTAHVILRDGKLNRSLGTVTETPIGQGDCPVDMIVSELTAASFYRPYYVAYEGSGDAFDAVQEGIRYFRDLPNRILEEMGLL